MCVLVMRDINEHKRPLEQILNQYTKFVKPAFEEFCLPVRFYRKTILFVTSLCSITYTVFLFC